MEVACRLGYYKGLKSCTEPKLLSISTAQAQWLKTFVKPSLHLGVADDANMYFEATLGKARQKDLDALWKQYIQV